MKKIKIKNDIGRRNLNEGRNYGVGFTILEKIDNFTFNALLPFTACKDYLNDIVYKTFYNTNINLTAYGYIATEMKSYKHKHFFYFGIRMLDYNSNAIWASKDNATTELISNVNNLVSVINNFEKYIGLSNYKTSLYKKNDELIILKCPMFWLKKTYLISLLSLLIRLFFNTNKENSTKSLASLLKKHIPFIPADKYNMSYIKKFLALKLNRNTLKTIYPKTNIPESKKFAIHNAGIYNFIEYYKNKSF